MRVSVPCRKNIKSLSVLVFVALIVALTIGSGFVKSQGQGAVGVANDGPSFVNIEIEEVSDIIFVHIALRDLNGWDDIYLVNVTVMDNLKRPISQVIYRQYRDPAATTPVIEWEEIVGDQLITEQSSWQAVEVFPWTIPDVSLKEIGLNVSFAFTTFPGDTISIVAWDKGLLNCESLGPFSAEFEPAPLMDSYVVPLSASLLIALASAAFMTLRRHYSNKLAKAIESKEAAAAED